MKKRILSLLCAAVLLIGLSMPALAYTPQEQYKNLNEIAQMIRQYGLGSSTSDDPLQKGLVTFFEQNPGAYEALMASMLSNYDRYTTYVPAGSYETTYPTNASYVGVGVTLEQYGSDLRVAALTEGGSAAKAGVMVGDILHMIGNTSAHGLSMEKASSLLRGEKGTQVSLSINRQGKYHTFLLTRSYIEISNFSSRKLEEGIYYMKLTRFADTASYLKFVFALQEMAEQQSKVLIFDLRGNPGGEVNMALNMINRLIPDKDVNFFSISSRNGNNTKIDTYTSEGIGIRLNKILLLCDKGSASASEIMVSSLGDLGYAETIGETTYGKARGQYHLLFDDNSAVVLTGLQLIPPSSKDYDGVGITPKYTVSNQLKLHPAAECAPVPERFLNITNWSEDTHKLNLALTALGFLKKPAGADMMEFDNATRDALNDFRSYYGIAPQNYLDTATAQKINARLKEFAGQKVLDDTQLQKALELAREYAKQPIQYTVDKLGNIINNKPAS